MYINLLFAKIFIQWFLLAFVVPNRRTVLKRAGGSIAGLGALSNVVGASGQTVENQGTADVGIEDEVNQLLRQREFEQAFDLMDKHDVRYGHDMLRVPATEVHPTSGLSTDQANYSESWFSFSWHDIGSPLYTLTNQWGIIGQGGLDCTSCVPDGVGFGWAGDKWEYEFPSFEGGTMGFQDDEVKNADSRGNGLIAEYHGIEMSDGEERGGWAEIQVEKQESGQHNLWAHYAHTWEPWLENVSVGFGIAVGGGSITVSFSGGNGGEWTTDDADYGVLEI